MIVTFLKLKKTSSEFQISKLDKMLSQYCQRRLKKNFFQFTKLFEKSWKLTWAKTWYSNVEKFLI